jgi:hypothetical protein
MKFSFLFACACWCRVRADATAAPVKPWKLLAINNSMKQFYDPSIPEKERCSQYQIPPGVKPGSCIQVMCMPTSVAVGKVFHMTVRWVCALVWCSR